MFHRRVALLLGLCAVAFAVLVVQMGRLTLVQGAELRAEAEKRLRRVEWMPTSRGRVVDRKGRVLAQDRPSLEVRVAYDVLISGLPESEGGEAGERGGGLGGRGGNRGNERRHTWVRAEAVRMARALHRGRWGELDAGQRAELADHYEPILLRHVEQMWPEIAQLTATTVEGIEQRRLAIRAQVERMREHLATVNLRKLREDAEERGRELTSDLEGRLLRQADKDIREQRIAHTIVGFLSDADGFRLEGRAHETTVLNVTPVGSRTAQGYEVPALPGLEVAGSRERAHPFDRVAVEIDGRTLPGPLRTEGAIPVQVEGAMTHVVGWMREGITREDEQRRAAWLEGLDAAQIDDVAPRGEDRGRYFPVDSVGERGVESAQEHRLRGLRGLRIKQLDTGEVFATPPAPGEDVELTIDAMLQARILAAMEPGVGLAKVLPWHAREDVPEGTPLNGAAVVIDINSGDVLALVSTPTFGYEKLASEREAIFNDGLNLPYMNRAVTGIYPPGSIAKAILLTAAVTKGVHDLHAPIACNGHFLPDRDDILRCWIYRDRYSFATHSQTLGHDPGAVDALRVSCNIYFYTVGSHLGRRGIVEAYRMFGAGEPVRLGVGLEAAGSVGPVEKLIGRNEDAIMGIGQGQVAWTPVHAADAYATLARGGVRIPPRVVRDAAAADEVVDLELDPASVAAAMEGLWQGANLRDGTGHHITTEDGQEPIFNAPGVTVWAKTGTAQSSKRVFDPDGDGPEPAQVREGDHAWVVGLVGPAGGGPKYAFAVLMEYAGSGGRVSGPIANQLIHALIAEGYLGEMASGKSARGKAEGGAPGAQVDADRAAAAPDTRVAPEAAWPSAGERMHAGIRRRPHAARRLRVRAPSLVAMRGAVGRRWYAARRLRVWAPSPLSHERPHG
jgi:penicillin-binding protein 2